MKKTIGSLAALMMLMAAPMMTSCSNNLDEVAPVEEIKENVVTLTIKMPEQAETRVGFNDGTLKLSGWEQGDVVKVYNYNNGVTGGHPFTCQDPSTGTFTGTLPAGKSLNDYNVAAYGHDLEEISGFAGLRASKVSDNLEDAIFLAGPISNSSCTMSICNNVLKVTNNGSAIDVAWKASSVNGLSILYCLLSELENCAPLYGCDLANDFDAAKFTIPAGVSYVFLPPMQQENGLVDLEGNYVVAKKEFGLTPVVGKLYNVTIEAAPAFGTGTAKRTGDIDVKWVQLWENGPKFAEYNVGVTDGNAESYGGYYAWGGNQDKVDDHNTSSTELTGSDDTATNLWGSNWRMPSSLDFAALRALCTETWTDNYNGTGIKGVVYTGKGDYTSNSIFLPAAGRYENELFDQSVRGRYWSSDVAVNLYFDSGSKNVQSDTRSLGCSVRAILAEQPDFTTTGTAKATINGSDVDVTWVQLWPGGPKFADRDVSTTAPMSFAEATAEPFVWGSNWCTPSKADMDELVKAASSTGSSIWVKCEYVNEGSGYGFKFTGRQFGYTETSLFLPSYNGNSSSGIKPYWTSTTASYSKAWQSRLQYGSGNLQSDWRELDTNDYAFVRPVLKN